MGARGSISVRSGKEESVTLFRHWGGYPEAMVGLVEEAFDEMRAGYRYGTEGYPSEVIALLTHIAAKYDRSSAYLGKDPLDGDNANFGHYVLEIGPAHGKELDWHLEHEGEEIWKKYGLVGEAEALDQPKSKRDNGSGLGGE